MPKKTRKAKLQADNRRTITPVVPTYEFRTSHSIAPSAHSSSLHDASEMRGIRMGLLKTSILALIAVSVEIVLYLRSV